MNLFTILYVFDAQNEPTRKIPILVTIPDQAISALERISEFMKANKDDVDRVVHRPNDGSPDGITSVRENFLVLGGQEGDQQKYQDFVDAQIVVGTHGLANLLFFYETAPGIRGRCLVTESFLVREAISGNVTTITDTAFIDLLEENDEICAKAVFITLKTTGREALATELMVQAREAGAAV